jgi:cobyrinic acid a,c-diamide synthase
MPGGLIVAAPASGSGKTVVTLALLRALARAGVRVASFKVGPDYIDPAFHAAASGRPCVNLDPWAMRPATVAGLLDEICRGADLVIGEGVMGLFDGAADGTGSTADLAAATGWPVIFVVDVRGQAASAAALVRGFAAHRADVAIAGVVFNRVGGETHGETLRRAMAVLAQDARHDRPASFDELGTRESLGGTKNDSHPELAPRVKPGEGRTAPIPAWPAGGSGRDIPVLGCLPRSESLAMPERHLGLIQAAEQTDLPAFLDRAADLAERHLDLALLRSLARPLQAARPPLALDEAGLPPLGQRIAVARDVAFAFAYPTQLARWRAAGASLSVFSPLADEPPAADADAVYLPGGYPELHAGRLAGNAAFLGGLRAAAARGATVYGECGGYMVLGESLTDAGGQAHAMAGLLPLTTSFAERRLHLGYRQAVLTSDCALGRGGSAFRGHEFHYCVVSGEGLDDPLFRCRDARGEPLGDSGRRRGTVMGSFVHLIDRAERAAVDVAR